MEEIRFYGRHYPQWREFSNFFPSKITLDGKDWLTVEHYYQANKSLDEIEKEEVRTGIPIGATRAGAAKDCIPNLTPGYSKREKLLSTGESKLIEASPTDYIWGEGADKSGQNLLGVLLMEVRAEIRNAVILMTHGRVFRELGDK